MEAHDIEAVKEWFFNLRKEMERLKIRHGYQVLNMDESGVRVGCPTLEKVIVPKSVTKLYTATQGSRKQITVIETVRGDGKQTLPPFIIAPGEHIMENWISEKLIGEEYIDFSSSGYINNSVIMKYGDHLIKHTYAGPNKQWKLLLLDGHESHYHLPFQLLLKENCIQPWYFLSHLTHALQPLDVGVFRPWKHYHSRAVNSALRSLDLQYTVTSLFRDLTEIRANTMQTYTICNAFEKAGMWPLSCEAGIKNIKSFSKEISKQSSSPNSLQLPQLPLPNSVETIWKTTTIVESFITRDPTQFSDNTVEVFKSTMKETSVQLQKAYLQATEHALLQQKIQDDISRKNTSRRTVKGRGSSGGGTVSELRFQIKAKEEIERLESNKKAKRQLSTAINKYKESLRVRGVTARKANRIRLKEAVEYRKRGEEPSPELLVLDREPDKEPTTVEAVSCARDSG